MQSRFIGGKEAQEHLSSMSQCPFNSFKHTRIVKIWPGQYFGFYRFDESSVNPIILGKAKVIDVGADDKGVFAKLIDCKTIDLYTIRHVPTYACGYEVAISLPHRAYIERTIKEITDESGSKNYSYGVASGLIISHLRDPDENLDDVDCMIDWFRLKDKFTDERAFYDEVDRFENKN